MSAREVIDLIKALPPEEKREVAAFFEAEQSTVSSDSPRERMSFQDAKKHVFTTYRDVLEKLAK